MIEKKFLSFVKENNLITFNDSIILSFSGGADSVCLFHLFLKIRHVFNLKMALFHLNHNLRGKESLRDENFVISFAKKYKVTLFIESANVKSFSEKNGLSIEEAGRILRYDYLQKISKKNNFNKIATAHHLDDQLETFFINFFKARGLTSFEGIKVKQNNIIRPLLNVKKSEILNYCSENKLDFMFDSSNDNNEFLRNRIRNILLPFIKENFSVALEKSVTSLSSQAKHLNDFIENYMEIFFKNRVKTEEKKLMVEISAFHNNKFIRFEIYKKIFSHFCVFDYRHGNLSMLDNFILSQSTTGIFKYKKIIFSKEYEKIVIYKEQNEPQKKDLNLETKIFKKNELSNNFFQNPDKNGYLAYLDSDKIKFPLKIRYFKNGDRFVPLGMEGNTKLKKFFSNAKIPVRLRKETPLLVDSNDNILWVIPYRIDNRVKITGKTENVLMCKVSFS